MSNNGTLKATGWAFGAECAAKLIVPITNMILARILDPQAFGIVVTINMVISFADMFTSAGFQKYIIQHDYKNEERLHNSATVAFWSNFSISMFALIIITIFNSQIASLVGSEGYGLGIVVASIALPLTSLSSIYEGLYKRTLNFRVLFLIRVLVCLVPLVVTIPLALLGFGYWSLIIGTLAGHILKNIIYVIYKRTWFPRLYYSFKELKEMLSFGIWTLLEACVSWMITYVDVFMVSYYLDTYYTGLYKTAQSTVTSTLSIITSAIQPVLFSVLSRYQSDEYTFKKEYLSFVKYTSLFMIPAGLGMLSYSDFLTRVLLGKQWIGASEFIGYWAFATALVCVFGELNREAYRAMNRPNVSFYVQLSHLIFVAPICFIAVKGGFKTLTIVRPLAYLEVIILHVICTKLVIKVPLGVYFKNIIPSTVCAVAMYMFSLATKRVLPANMISQFIQIVMCVLVYGALICCIPSYRELIFKAIQEVKKRGERTND